MWIAVKQVSMVGGAGGPTNQCILMYDKLGFRCPCRVKPLEEVCIQLNSITGSLLVARVLMVDRNHHWYIEVNTSKR